MDTTNVLISYFMTVDMHRFAFLWLVYVETNLDPNISEKCVPGGTNFSGGGRGGKLNVTYLFQHGLGLHTLSLQTVPKNNVANPPCHMSSDIGRRHGHEGLQ